MFDYRDTKNKPIVITKKKITIELALGIGAYNPDETRAKPQLIEYYPLNARPWIKYDNHWYFIKNYDKFDSIQSIKSYFDKNCYTEEQFLEEILNIIAIDDKRQRF